MKIFEIIFTALVDGEEFTHASTIYANNEDEAKALLKDEMGVMTDDILSIRVVVDLPDAPDLSPRTIH